jgi:HK97 gp10 family phage protein
VAASNLFRLAGNDWIRAVGKASRGGVGGRIRIDGLAELDRKLKLLPKKVAGKISRKALRAGSKVILKEAKALAPVATGTLKASLKVKSGKRKRGFVSVQVQTADGDYRGETFYGAFLEYGHKSGKRNQGKVISVRRGKRGRPKITRDDKRKTVPAKPYMAPAFVRKKYAALAAIKAELHRGIESGAGALK